MNDDQSFTGTCPTCGQRYCGAEIERLRRAVQELSEKERMERIAAFCDEMKSYGSFEPVTAEMLAQAIHHIVKVSDETAMNMADILADSLGQLYRQRKR
jgi:hypothetical protein